MLGFFRLATNPRVFATPISAADALRVVDSWFAQPQVVALSPGDEHWRALRTLVDAHGAAANAATDAHLAALAIENGADLCSADADFGRFAGLRWVNPLR